MTTRVAMVREGRQPGARPRWRYNLYLDDGLDEYIAELSRNRWRGHKDFSAIIRQIIREHREQSR